MSEYINDREFSARFWSQVHIPGVESVGYQARCWLWTGATRKARPGACPVYGRIRYKDKKFTTHRVAYELYYGKPLLDDEILLHACDNPLCNNPHHLTPGTRAENRMDSVLKGRHSFGERHPRARLSESDVIEIRKAYKAGGWTYRKLAEHYKVGKTTIQGIIERKIWAYLDAQ